MPQGRKAKYPSKQKRQAKHIEDSEKKSDKSAKEPDRVRTLTLMYN